MPLTRSITMTADSSLLGYFQLELPGGGVHPRAAKEEGTFDPIVLPTTRRAGQ